MTLKHKEQAKIVMQRIREKGLDEMCSQMDDEKLELVVRSLLKS
jgi:hypothetical protein